MPLCRTAGLAFLLVSFSASAGSVSVTNGMKKIRANDPAVAQGITAVSIEAAKNEFESFQIVVRGPATQVTARATSLTGPNGSTISAATCGIPGNIRLYQERFLNIGTQLGTLAQGTCSTAPIPPPLSDKLGQGGLVPDPLIPQVDEFDNQCRNFAFDVDANQNRTIYVEVFVPATAAPGIYTGQVDVSWTDSSVSCGVSQQAIQVQLNVFDFMLKGKATLRTHFGSSVHGGLKQQHGVTDGPALTALVARYATLALDHRISMTAFDDGSSFSPTGFPTAYDANFGPVLRGSTPGLRLYQASPSSIIYMGDKSNSATYGTWIEYMKSNGWSDPFFTYTVDEPGTQNGSFCDIGPLGTTAHQATSNGTPDGATLRTLVTKDFHALATSAAPNLAPGCTSAYTIDPPASGATADVNIMTALIDVLDATTGNTKALYSTARPPLPAWLSDVSGPSAQPINQLWTYESCDSHGCASCNSGNAPAQSTSTTTLAWPSIGTVDHPLIRARAMPWFAYKNNASGYLYYDTVLAFSSGPESTPRNASRRIASRLRRRSLPRHPIQIGSWHKHAFLAHRGASTRRADACPERPMTPAVSTARRVRRAPGRRLAKARRVSMRPLAHLAAPAAVPTINASRLVPRPTPRAARVPPELPAVRVPRALTA